MAIFQQPKSRVTGLVTAGVAATLILSACTSMVAGIEEADDSTNPDCAEIMVALPEKVANLERRRTDTQSTAAWGEPAAVILRCGVEVPGPTTDHCVEANGVDWVVREEGENWRITTYGRDPAVEVLFDDTRAGSSSVMVDLGPAMERIEQTRFCTSGSDVPTVAPTPSLNSTSD